MKVGIITKHAIRNPGSFLQAYGLQRTIEKLGYEAEIIDYTYPNAAHTTSPSLKGRLLHNANFWLKNLLPGALGYRYERNYKDCQQRFYKLSRLYPTQDAIFADPPEYDVYVTGSDQIWRPEFTNGDPAFFADFAPPGKRRLSYASSFGCVSIPDSYVSPYRSLLGKLEAISVREQSGVDIVRSLTHRDAALVVDPSLLLTGAEWRELLVPPEGKKKYVVCYGGSQVDFCHQLAHRFADTRGYEVVRIVGSFFDYFNRHERYVLDAGPLEWLGLIDGAEMVFVGGSFHGTALSILLHKPFVSILRDNADHDTRQLNILEMMGLTHCGIGALNARDVDLDRIYGSFDWDRIDEELGRFRLSSVDFLASALKG